MRAKKINIMFAIMVLSVSALLLFMTENAVAYTADDCDPQVITDDRQLQYCRDNPDEYFESINTSGTSYDATECNFDGKEGFVTSSPFGEEGEDYEKIPGTNTYCVAEQQGDDITTNPIFTLLNTVIQFLSAGIFIVGILMITIAGIQYITAGGNPEATKAARGKIGKVVTGLLLYFFFVAIMNFLIPGGIFN